MDNSEIWIFSSEIPYLEMQTSFLNLLLKMPSLLTTSNSLQNSSKFNSKPPIWLLQQKLNTLQVPNESRKNSKWDVWDKWEGRPPFIGLEGVFLEENNP